MASVYIWKYYVLLKKNLLNIKYNYHVHKWDTRGTHDFHVSGCTTSLYQKKCFKYEHKII